MVAGGHAWLLGGMRGEGGVHGEGGRAWDTTRYGDTINERAVRILLECILVMMWHYDVVAIFLCTETVTISSRGPPNQNFKRQNRSIPKHTGVVFGTHFT